MFPAATSEPNGVPRFFPVEASSAEKQYVIYDDRCGESAPVDARLSVETGVGILDVELDMDNSCRPPGGPRRHAMEIPPPPAGPIGMMLVRTTIPGTQLELRDVAMRRLRTVPFAMTGTWRASGHSEQGLLIDFDDAGNAVIAWTTYRADGSQMWLSGVSQSSGSANGVFSVELSDTGLGVFASGGRPERQPHLGKTRT